MKCAVVWGLVTTVLIFLCILGYTLVLLGVLVRKLLLVPWYKGSLCTKRLFAILVLAVGVLFRRIFLVHWETSASLWGSSLSAHFIPARITRKLSALIYLNRSPFYLFIFLLLPHHFLLSSTDIRTKGDILTVQGRLRAGSTTLWYSSTKLLTCFRLVDPYEQVH